MKDSIDERRAAEEHQAEATGERVPVAGRDYMPIEKSVKDKLGDDWKIDQQSGSLIAMRMKVKTPDNKLSTKVSDEIRTLRKDKDGLSAMRNGNAVTIMGRLEDCKDAGAVADRFASIDGIDKIVINFSCTAR